MSAIVHEYKIIDSWSHIELAGKVEEEIKAGWQPVGGPFYALIDENDRFFQAMVK